MTARRLAVEDVNGARLDYVYDKPVTDGGKPKHSPHHSEIDLSHVPNANAQCPLVLVVQEKCNLDHWHAVQRITLPPWGSE